MPVKNFLNPDKYLPILNGLIGDKLASKSDSWAIPMSFRMDGKDVAVAELPKALKGRAVLVFIHGLMADETIWKPLRKIEKDISVLYVRYNTGLHISQNGQALAQLVDSFFARLSPRKIYLVGHSMGGLVTRSACYYAQKAAYPWVKKVSAIFLIAVPNAGAPLEKLGSLTTAALKRIAVWHLGKVGDLLNQRSDGIKDLRLGAMLEQDWNHPKMQLNHRRAPVPPLMHISYFILIGSLSADESSLMSKYFGDGLVTQRSAVGETLLKTATIQVFPKTGHNSILSHPDVLKYIRNAIS